MNGRIQSLTLDLARLREKYKAGHPEVQKVQVQLEQLETDKEARVSQIEESLRAEYRQLQRSEAELKSAIEGHKTRAAEQSRKLTELESLKKQADAAGGLYGVLLQKLNETNIAASIQDDNVRLLDRAVVPMSPVWPRKRQLSLVSLLAGLLLGAGWVLLRDALDNKIKDADDVERRLIPKYTKEDDELAKEAYQNLRTALLFSRRKDRGHVVLVTGAAPGEGKTTTLLQLGRRLADAQERTVVVDCDLRKANLHTRLNVPREPGFTDYFVGQSELMGLVRSTRFANLSIIPAGTLPPNPPALIAREEFETALEQLRQNFQWILIDSPPVAAVTDALLLARQADSTVLVVQQNRVDRAVVKRAVASLRKVTPRVVGAVLNAVDIKSKGYYGYGYGYGYSYSKSKQSGPRGRRMVGHRSRKGRVTPTEEVSDASPS
jgi:capsular exopolysaccharide synthesis family protein